MSARGAARHHSADGSERDECTARPRDEGSEDPDHEYRDDEQGDPGSGPFVRRVCQDPPKNSQALLSGFERIQDQVQAVAELARVVVTRL
jgi:hypothetical protein